MGPEGSQEDYVESAKFKEVESGNILLQHTAAMLPVSNSAPDHAQLIDECISFGVMSL